MRAVLILALAGLMLAACGRPLTQAEQTYAASYFGDQLDPARVRFVRGHFAQSHRMSYQARPRVTCQERIFPAPKGDSFETSPGAIALFQHVLYRKDLYRGDFTAAWLTNPDQPDKGAATNLYDLMLFAHEMTHVWQWQNRDRTGYAPWRAALEHRPGHDPYLFDLNSRPDFLSFPYEQQAAIVEEFTCCRALAPKAARTERLYQMLAKVMPITRLQSRIDAQAIVPWKGVETEGICD